VLRGNLAVVRSELAADPSIVSSVVDMENACNRAAALVRQILTFGSRQRRTPAPGSACPWCAES
jgi:hypothetical protein